MILTQLTDTDALTMAARYGAKYSQDPHTHNGAGLVTRHGHHVWAANRFPEGVIIAADRLERPNKYRFIEHAERNVIFKAAQHGFATNGATLYCPWFACADCARAIICAGISRVVGHIKPRLHTTERWQATIELADHMLREAGVQITLLNDELGIKYLFDGTEFEL